MTLYVKVLIIAKNNPTCQKKEGENSILGKGRLAQLTSAVRCASLFV